MTQQEFQWMGRTIRYAGVAEAAQAAGRSVSSLPYVHRILLENLCRSQRAGRPVGERDIAALLEKSDAAELPLFVSRVILPDSSGLPALQDLAALRSAVDRVGGNVTAVDALVPVDLVVDHSLQVDFWGDAAAEERNLARELERNAERYRFLKWAQQAFRRLRIHPPGTGIIHQVNIESIASVVVLETLDGADWAFPDFVIGGDSHTPMVNGLGVLGWGVGGIDAEAAMLGQAYIFPRPQVVGVRLSGRIRPPAMTTDAALLVTQKLRAAGVTGCMVEYFGPAIPHLTVAERATMANMAPEYGATCGFFPVDEQSIAYLRQTGREEDHIGLVEAYCKANHLWRADAEECPDYDRIVDIDLSEAEPSLAGPRRPQDRMTLAGVAEDFREKLTLPLSQGGFGAEAVEADPAEALPGHGSIALAAITSCTNTSNPAVMMAAGLVARRAVELGLTVPAWVKTSMAPGSRVVTRYLEKAGLLPFLEALGFNIIGYGCTTCGGKSGPLPQDVANAIERRGLVAAAVLSGNRNFEGRIHKLIRANYIGAPPLVVLYALAGRVDIDFDREPVGLSADGNPVHARDLWPTPEEIEALLPQARDRDLFSAVYGREAAGAAAWEALEAPAGALFPWDRSSHYLVEPPFFEGAAGRDPVADLAQGLSKARVLAAFGDSLTTDHISPSGEIPLDTPAGRYLADAGIAQKDFNTYVGRRGNFEVMTRATFANIRIKNALLPDVEGGFTRHFPDGETVTIFDAARRYRTEGTAAIILGGKEYGTGSSRDWAAKGTALLGIRAVIAESYERIHRANLVGMGVLPLAFRAGEGWRQLGLTGGELFSFAGIEEAVRTGAPVRVTAEGEGGTVEFEAVPQLLTEAERALIASGGILMHVLDAFSPASGSKGMEE
ncbi:MULTISPECIES: aconitate hydratase AcnA [unclassified Shinella]|uniref:aconitate hydratase AcnA n=1 Tax=unclassified Shinella TaxID=2643062 RepID=UPI00225C9C31|nr:aconitate hydratase AcnA [Shinella sp. YE25]MDC7258847.1 aconitate hydratase AcnA [Shinella sp. YE25]CAI0334376.1 Aconitate hydratase A [Rhizobiaceae bacterium]CAK7260559.1 Aconitate hydratase A [Shinella sp. WSC3-e]